MLALTAATKLGAQQLTDAAIVQQFCPQSLIDEWSQQHPGSQLNRKSDYALVDLDGTGALSYIAAAYTNGIGGWVRLLRLQGNGAVLAAEPSVPAMGGLEPFVSLVDIDGDGKYEILATFSSNGGYFSAWLFKWTGATLQLISPVDSSGPGYPYTLVSNVSFADLDGDGILELIGGPGNLTPGDLERLNGADPVQKQEVYKLVAGAYQPSAVYYYLSPFLRQTGPPQTTTETFAVDTPGANWVLTISNGLAPSPLGPATSADVYLNGVLVVGPSSFNPNVKVITVPVTLQATNTISVTLRGAPNTGFTIAIGKQQ
jgi:FG-GAP-like repeat